jgi:prolyl-tRNA synthetase
MGAYYKNDKQQSRPIVMGCYGIGVGRTMQAVVEQHHDDKGIIWPMSVAPYHVIVTIVKMNDEEQVAIAESIYEKLQAAGVEVLLDDRKERAGVKFNDADLIGIPIRITVGRDAASGSVEYKLRRDAESELIAIDEAVERAIRTVNEEK